MGLLNVFIVHSRLLYVLALLAQTGCSAPKDDTGLLVSKAMFEAPLTVLGEFLDSPDLPPSTYLNKIEHAVTD